jgi:hypothetical protein
MPLSADDLAELDKMLSSTDTDGTLFAALRSRFPGMSLTRCEASDVTEEPFRSYPQFDLHLLNTTDHCAQITADPATATGIILAKRS